MLDRLSASSISRTPLSPFNSIGITARTEPTHIVSVLPRRFRPTLYFPVFLGDLDGTGSFVPVTDASVSVSCGCSTPPAAPLPPAPAPTVDDGGVPLGAVIGGSVGGAAFLAIVGFLVVKRNRAKRDDKSFGAAPPGPVNYPVGPQGGRDGGASAGKGGAAPPPPPPAYAEPSPPHASAAHPGDDLPPPPAYSEPPAYSG